MAAQQGKLKKPEPLIEGAPTRITKAKTMQYLKKQSEQAMIKVKDMKSKQDSLQNQKQDLVENTIDMLVEQARVQDELHRETGIEHADFELALMSFMQTDPEVKNSMQDYMRQMRELMENDIPEQK